MVFTRDQQSFDVANQLSPKARLLLATDVALRMPYQKSTIETSQINVGINISGLLWNGGYNGKNDFNIKHSYKTFITNAVNYFLSLENVKIHLISHVISTIPSSIIEDDFLAAMELKDKIFKNNDAVVVAERFTNPITAKSYISSMDFLQVPACMQLLLHFLQVYLACRMHIAGNLRDYIIHSVL